jgi:ketosteroid isomerase-like protein
MRPVVLLVLVLLPACAAAPGSPAPRAFTAADRAAVEAVLAGQRDAWNRETRASYRQRYGGDRAGMGRLAFEILGVQPVGADGAVVLGRWTLTETPQAGGGIFTVVLERRAEGWRVVHDHTSSDPK